MCFRRFFLLLALTGALSGGTELVPVEKFAEGAKIAQAKLSQAVENFLATHLAPAAGN